MICKGVVFDSIADLYIRHKERFRTLEDGEDIFPYDVYIAEHGAILYHSGAKGESQGKMDLYSYPHFRLKEEYNEAI